MNLSTVIFRELHLSILKSKSGLDFTSNNGIKGGVKTLNDFLKKYELSYSKLRKYTQEQAENAFGGFYNQPFSEKKDIDSLTDDEIRKYLFTSPNKTKPATMLQISLTKWLARVNKLDNIQFGNFDRKGQVITKIEEEEVVVNKVSESADLIKCIEEDIVNQYNETIKELKESSEAKDKIFLTLEEIIEYFEVKPSNILELVMVCF